MVGWYHRLRHEFEQAPGDDEGQGSLVCCNPWGHKEPDTTERLNNNSKRPPCWVSDWLHSAMPIPSPTLETLSVGLLCLKGKPSASCKFPGL